MGVGITNVVVSASETVQGTVLTATVSVTSYNYTGVDGVLETPTALVQDSVTPPGTTPDQNYSFNYTVDEFQDAPQVSIDDSAHTWVLSSYTLNSVGTGGESRWTFVFTTTA